jgi:putative ABC transport system ATP-binding protein
MELIKIEKVHKAYSQKGSNFNVLKGLSFTVEEGAFVIIMGKSGSGKTTLLNLIGLLDKFDGGKYIYDGIEVNTMNDNQRSTFRNKHIGFIFQQFHLIESLNIAQNIELPLLYNGNTNSSQRDELVKKVLAQVGLSEKIRNYPNELSGGQQQRVSIARSLINNPKVILADEPTGALDSSTGMEIIKLLMELNSQGRTIIMVTHDDDFKKYASQLLLLKDGVFVKVIEQ